MRTRKQIQRKKKTRKLRLIPSVWKDPRNILYYLAERGIPRFVAEVEDVVVDAREYLQDEDYMWGIRLWETAKHWPVLSELDLLQCIQKSRTQKYIKRPSPKFPAGLLCGVTLKGNDGHLYTSTKIGTSCAWKRVGSVEIT